MADEHDKTSADQEEGDSGEPRCGERLAAARREQQISVLEVAKELHLDEQKVRALERNEFDMLGAPVFAKGHLRKYAHLVGVDESDVFTDYYQMTRADGLPPVVLAPRGRKHQELSPGPWIAVIIVILAAVASYWWFAVEAENAEVAPSQDNAPIESPQPEQRTEVDEPAAAEPVPATAQAVEVTAQEVVVAAAPEAVPAPAVDAAPDTGQTSLALSYTGDCWTEISDATGRRLYFDMGRSGLSVDLEGEAPFAVLLGNVDNVDVSIDGREYPISTTNPGGRMARLTITNP